MALQVWLPLNGNLENQGLSNVNVINYNATVDSSGKIGSCYSLSVGNYLGLDAPNVNNHKYSPISVALWFYPTQNDSTDRSIIGCWENGGGGFFIKNQKIGVSLYIGGSYITCNAPSTITLNLWHHICYTYDGTIIRLYIDGEQVATTSASGPITYHSTCPWQIGGNPSATAWGSGNLAGKINDVRIYDNCLSPQEVKEISQGLVLHYKLDSISNLILPKEYKQLEYIESTGTQYLNLQQTITSSTGIIVDMQLSYPVSTTYYPIWCVHDGTMYYEFFVKNGYVAALRWGNSAEVVPSPSDILFVGTNRVYSDVYKGVYKLNGRIAWTGNTSYTSTTTKDICIFRYIKSDGTIDSRNTTGKIYFIQLYGDRDVYLIPAKRISDGAIGMYDTNSNTFYNNAGTGTFTAGPEIVSQIQDCSGYKYDGTVNGSISLVSDVPRYESGTQFTTTSYINCTSPTEEARSASFWVKIDSAPTANQVMFVDYKSRLAFGIHYNNALLLTCRDTSIKEKVATAFTLGQWHHVVVVNPGTSPTATTRTLYIDGVAQAEHATSSYFTHSTDALQIGRRSYSNNSVVNQLVDFRLYTTALSAEDALDLYHTSAIVDNLGNLHTFQAKEDVSTPEIMKTGDAITKNFLELGNKIKTLSDGSVWLYVLHHENPASNMFTENNCWNYDNGSTLYSALWLLQNDVWKYDGKYELLACEKLTSSSSEVQYRWTQTSNPATTSTATGFQLLSGTANKLTDGLVNEGTHGCFDIAGSNWWCCCGAYSQYQNGVPGFGGTITSGSLDLYIRITQDIFKNPESDLFSIYETGYVQNELIEI